MDQFHNNMFKGLRLSNKKMKVLRDTSFDLADNACREAEVAEEANDKLRTFMNSNAGSLYAFGNKIVGFLEVGEEANNPEKTKAAKQELKKLRADLTASNHQMKQDDVEYYPYIGLPARRTDAEELRQGRSFDMKRNSLLTKQRKLQIRLDHHAVLLRQAYNILAWANTQNLLLNLEYLKITRANVSADYKAPFPGYPALIAQGVQKTMLCPFWINHREGSCLNGAGCVYAHGPDDVRIKACKSIVQNGHCTYGASCNFFHPE